MYDLGARLKSIRLQRGLTQKMLAHQINKSVSAISSYESNVQLPPLDVLQSIAAVLNVSIDFLVGLDHNNTYSTNNLSEKQVELIDLLFQEFQKNDSAGEHLTDTQIHIVQKMIHLFSKSK